MNNLPMPNNDCKAETTADSGTLPIAATSSHNSSKPNVGGSFVEGYKGKGMCANCYYQSNEKNSAGCFTCGYYGSFCKLVSRNCPGIRILK